MLTFDIIGVMLMLCFVVVFFFKQKTVYEMRISDWSSDVCSSDLFFALPAGASLFLSFTDFDIYALADIGNLRFVGFQNYERLVENPLFWKAMTNTLLFVAVGTPLIVALSLFAAILVNSRWPILRPAWRVALLAPFVIGRAHV